MVLYRQDFHLINRHQGTLVRVSLLSQQATEVMETMLRRISIDPNICHGPCIRGLRYPVEFILELLSSGMSIEEILADYDDLEREDLLAALLFATRLTQVKSIYRVT